MNISWSTLCRVYCSFQQINLLLSTRNVWPLSIPAHPYGSDLVRSVTYAECTMPVFEDWAKTAQPWPLPPRLVIGVRTMIHWIVCHFYSLTQRSTTIRLVAHFPSGYSSPTFGMSCVKTGGWRPSWLDKEGEIERRTRLNRETGKDAEPVWNKSSIGRKHSPRRPGDYSTVQYQLSNQPGAEHRVPISLLTQHAISSIVP